MRTIVHGASISPAQALTLCRWHLLPMKLQKRSNGTSQPKYWILAWRMPPSLRRHRCPIRSRSRSNPPTQCHYCPSTPMFRPTYHPRARKAVHRPDYLAPPSAHFPHHPHPKCGGTALQRQRRHTANPAIDAHYTENFPPMTYERTYITIDSLRVIPKATCAAKRTVVRLCSITTGA